MSNPIRFLGRHVGASIAGGVAVAALAGGGIAYAATSPSSSAAPAATAPTPTTTTPTSGPAGDATTGTKSKGAKRAHGVRGTITTINGDTWTIRTPKGEAVTVTITAQTQFGTKKSPATAASFTTGSPATVLGQRSGSSVTATRVIVPQHPLGSGTSTPTSAAG